MQNVLTVFLTAIWLVMLVGCGRTNINGAEPMPHGSKAAYIDVYAEDISLPRMLMVNGTLYYDSGELSEDPRLGMTDGKITGSVKTEEVPGRDDESNFGAGFSYQYGINDTLEVKIDNEWHIFKAD